MLSPEEIRELQALFARLPADAMARRAAAVTLGHPDDPRGWFLLGASQHRLGNLPDSLRAFEKTLELDAGHMSAANARAAILMELGRGADALVALEQAALRFPNDPTTLTNLGFCLEQDLAGTPRALACYESALAADPAHRGARMNRGHLLTRMGRPLDAVVNNRELAARYPQDAVAHFNLAESLLAAMRSEESLAACDRALALDRGFVQARLTQALALAELGRLHEAGQSMRLVEAADPAAIGRAAGFMEQSRTMPPVQVDPEAIYLNRGFVHLASCDWRRRDDFLESFRRHMTAILERGSHLEDLSFAYAMLETPLPMQLHRRLMEKLSAQFESHARGMRSVPYDHPHRPRKTIRIGYLSPDYREHLNARLTLPIYRLHDRGGFEVHCYSLHPDDGSEIRKAVSAAADHFVEVSGLPSDEIANRIHADGVDILVDLAGITRYSRPDVFAFRPAPIQVSYLGFPGTLGANYIQYRIADRVSVPSPQREYWSESLAYLPDTFYIYDNAEPLAAPGVKRSDYGLSDEAFVFCAFHAFYKIEPQIFEVWMRLLERVPGSVLWMMGPDTVARENLRRECAFRNIDPGRLAFAPMESRERYRERFQLADLYLDTPLFNAMTTACDALWAGLPIITVPGEAFASRVSSSLLAAAGLPDCILPSLAAYETKALQLATDAVALKSLRSRVEFNRDKYPLFDTPARVRQLEYAYAEMWRRHTHGEPPGDFEVPP